MSNIIAESSKNMGYLFLQIGFNFFFFGALSNFSTFLTSPSTDIFAQKTCMFSFLDCVIISENNTFSYGDLHVEIFDIVRTRL